jgi:hypothetical protein
MAGKLSNVTNERQYEALTDTGGRAAARSR